MPEGRIAESRLFFGLTLALLALLLLATPSLAQKTYTERITGSRSAPAPSRTTPLRRHLRGPARRDLPGFLEVSIDYIPPNPRPAVTNNIVGGIRVLQVFRGGGLVDTICGPVTGGTAAWNANGTRATVCANLAITSATGRSGSGTFTGTLSHLTFPPTWWGTLRLAY